MIWLSLRWRVLLLVTTLLLVTVVLLRARVGHVSAPVAQDLPPEKTIADRSVGRNPAARERLTRAFRQAGVSYPPRAVVLAAFKLERVMDLYAGAPGEMRYVRSYPIRGASGVLGPKLRYGDRQVPEGVYEVESLNPNSQYHLSLRLSYPNAFDRRQGRREGRRNLGRDIMIHGGTASVGCLAMGDEPIEELFTLAADVGLRNVSVLISPVDFRVRDLPPDTTGLPAWCDELYALIRQRLAQLPRPGRGQ